MKLADHVLKRVVEGFKFKVSNGEYIKQNGRTIVTIDIDLLDVEEFGNNRFYVFDCKMGKGEYKSNFFGFNRRYEKIYYVKKTQFTEDLINFINERASKEDIKCEYLYTTSNSKKEYSLSRSSVICYEKDALCFTTRATIVLD